MNFIANGNTYSVTELQDAWKLTQTIGKVTIHRVVPKECAPNLEALKRFMEVQSQKGDVYEEE